MRSTRHRLTIVTIFALVCSVSGGGPKEIARNPVAGAVTWKGQPVKSGTTRDKANH